MKLLVLHSDAGFDWETRMQSRMQEMASFGNEVRMLDLRFAKKDFVLKSIAWCDFVLFQRVLEIGVLKLMQAAQGRFGKMVIMDADQHYHAIPDAALTAPMVKSKIQNYTSALAVADLVLASSPLLAARIAHLCRKVEIFPDNLPYGLSHGVEDKTVSGWIQKIETRSNGLTKVLVAGNVNHQLNLDEYAQALKTCAEKNKNLFWVFVGVEPPKRMFGIARRNFIKLPFLSVNQYFLFLSKLNPQVYLHPLVPNEFNRTASDLKLQEALWAGAVLVTNVDEPFKALNVPKVILPEANPDFSRGIKAALDLIKGSLKGGIKLRPNMVLRIPDRSTETLEKKLLTLLYSRTGVPL